MGIWFSGDPRCPFLSPFVPICPFLSPGFKNAKKCKKVTNGTATQHRSGERRDLKESCLLPHPCPPPLGEGDVVPDPCGWPPGTINHAGYESSSQGRPEIKFSEPVQGFQGDGRSGAAKQTGTFQQNLNVKEPSNPA